MATGHRLLASHTFRSSRTLNLRSQQPPRRTGCETERTSAYSLSNRLFVADAVEPFLKGEPR